MSPVGVITAARMSMATIMCRRYRRMSCRVSSPNRPSSQLSIGIWNIMPMTSVRVARVFMYDSRVMVFVTDGSTWYVARNRNVKGNMMR